MESLQSLQKPSPKNINLAKSLGLITCVNLLGLVCLSYRIEAQDTPCSFTANDTNYDGVLYQSGGDYACVQTKYIDGGINCEITSPYNISGISGRIVAGSCVAK